MVYIDRRDLYTYWGTGLVPGPAPAHMVVSPTTLDFSVTLGGASLNEQFITISSSGGTLAGPTVGTITYGLGWASGITTRVVQNFPVGVVGVRVDPGLLTEGTYTATLELEDAAADNTPQTVGVTLTILAPPLAPVIDINQPFTFNGTAGGADTADQTITITNKGGGSFANLAVGNLVYGPGATNWLAKPAGQAGFLNGQTISGHAVMANIPSAGNYTASFDITADNATNSPFTVAVQATASASVSPIMTFGAQTASFAAFESGGNPSAQSITIQNGAGGGALAGPAVGTITYASGTGWLTTAAITTVTAGQSYRLNVGVTTGALTGSASGTTYSASFPVTDANATNSPVVVTVNFTITTITTNGNYPPPRFTMMDGAVFDPNTGRITWDMFGHAGLLDPDGDPNSASFAYGASGTLNPGVATTRSCTTAAQLTTALANCVNGDIIEIAADFTTTVSFTLRARGDSGWVLIRSANEPTIPEGQRVSPADFATTKVLTNNQAGYLFQVHQSSAVAGYHFRGLRITNGHSDPFQQQNGTSVAGYLNAATTSTNIAHMSQRLKIERCYWDNPWTSHGDKYVGRAIYLGSRYVLVRDNYMPGFCYPNHGDSQWLAGDNGLGDYQIYNNYGEGASENVILGGGATTFGQQTYHKNVHIKGNHLPKRLEWANSKGYTAGGSNDVQGQTKNFVETKHGSQWVIEENFCENHGGGDQGVAFGIKISPQSIAEHGWASTHDITIRNNFVTYGMGGVEISTGDGNGKPGGGIPTGPNATRRVEVWNNAFVDNNPLLLAGNATRYRSPVGGYANATLVMSDIVFDHNMMSDYQCGMALTPRTPPNNVIVNLVITNNIWAYYPTYVYANAVTGNNTYNAGALSAYCGTAFDFRNNAFLVASPNTPKSYFTTGGGDLRQAPYNSIVFTTQAELAQNIDMSNPYHRAVLPTSVLYHAATDSTAQVPRDIGPDWDLLQYAIAARS